MATQTTVTRQLSDRHYAHCVTERGLDPRWIEANCRSADIPTASARLGYAVKSPGILLEGVAIQIQFRPDKPWKSDDEKKAPKYRSPLGDFDAMLPKHPDIPDFWENLEALKQYCWHIDGHPCLILTEGFFKAIAGCAIGIPTVALLGVEMGLTSAKDDPQGKRYLVPSLERLAKAGFGFMLGFDADCADNEQVNRAQLKLAHQLKRFDVPIYNITGLWAVEQGKGMDDYIKNHGGDAFKRNILGKTQTLENWERQLRQNQKDPKASANPPASEIADELAEKHRDKLAWVCGMKIWRRYSAKQKGVWGQTPEEFIWRLVMAHCRATLPKSFNAGYVSSIVQLLKAELAVDEWEEEYGIVPFRNGIYSLETRLLEEHAPGRRLTWSLPYEYNKKSTCEPIQQWLLEAAGGKEDVRELLRAYLNAIVTGRADLQVFLELVGPGGTGKSTYIRLAQALIGIKNNFTTELKHLESNRFETSGIVGKRLVTITDSERYGGNVTVVKALTGEDTVRNERKNVQNDSEGFIYDGMVIVACNEMVQSADYTSGLQRRRITVPFLNKIPSHLQRNLVSFRRGQATGEFVPHLSGLLNWVLDMTPEDVTRRLKNLNLTTSLEVSRNEHLLETNPIADWIDACTVIVPDIKTYVGIAQRDKRPDSSTQYLNVSTWLYASYREYCAAVGSNGVSARRFTPLVRDLLGSQLSLNVQHGNDRKGSYFEGLTIRKDGDHDYINRPISQRSASVMDLAANVTENVTPETQTGDGCDGCDGFLQDAVQSCAESFQEDSSSLTADEAILQKCITPSQAIADEAFSLPSEAENNPSPKISLHEAKLLLCMAQNLLPSSDARLHTYSQLEALTDGLDLDDEFWCAFSAVLSIPVQPGDVKTAEWHSFPHYDINASAETKRNAAMRIFNALLKATSFGALAKAIYQIGNDKATLAWVAANCLGLTEREAIWGVVKNWLDGKLQPQLKLDLLDL